MIPIALQRLSWLGFLATFLLAPRTADADECATHLKIGVASYKAKDYQAALAAVDKASTCIQSKLAKARKGRQPLDFVVTSNKVGGPMGGISFRGYFVLRKPYSPNTHMGQMGARAKLTCDLGGRSRVDSTGFPLGEEDMKVGEEAEWFFWIDGMKIKQPARCRLRVTYEDEGTKKTYLLHDHGYDLTP